MRIGLFSGDRLATVSQVYYRPKKSNDQPASIVPEKVYFARPDADRAVSTDLS